jgi:hypothetical protein
MTDFFDLRNSFCHSISPSLLRVTGEDQVGVPGEILIFVTVAASKSSLSPKSKELRFRPLFRMD